MRIDELISKLREFQRNGATHVVIGRDFAPVALFDLKRFENSPNVAVMNIVFIEERQDEFSGHWVPTTHEELERRRTVDEAFGEKVQSGAVSLQDCEDYMNDVLKRR